MKRSVKCLSIMIALVMVCMALAACGGKKEEKSSEWPITGLGAMLPRPEKGKPDITFDWDELFSATIKKTDKETYKKYVEACKAEGFTVEAEEKNSSISSYRAYNADGYELELHMYGDDEFDIDLRVPEKLDTLTWPKVGLAALVPEPESKTGKIIKDSSDRFEANVGDSTLDDYKTYGGLCYDYGFAFDYDNAEDHYYAYNAEGVYLRLRYEGNNIMSISLEAPEETTAAPETTAPETTAAPETQAPETAAPETQAPETQADSGIIRPEIKEAIDSYEAFVDEYCEFMRSYDVTDITMLVKYSELVAKEVEMTKQFNDIADKDLNDVEAAYFLEVDARCVQKMAEAAANIGH